MTIAAWERGTPWMRWCLAAAAVYNVAWGTFVVLSPLTMFRWAGMEPPNHPQIWQCVGMIVGVYGVGYGVAATAPLRHWPIVLVGFLGKVFGPIGFLQAAFDGSFPWVFGLNNLTNDVIWWIPFAGILYAAWSRRRNEVGEAAGASLIAAGER